MTKIIEVIRGWLNVGKNTVNRNLKNFKAKS